MVKLVVIADDFTGALDTGVQFSKKGISTHFIMDHRLHRGRIGTDVNVLVVDTETRHVESSEAYTKVATLIRCCQDLGFHNYYKKTDSTLRGNIGSECGALLNTHLSSELIFVPAYPRTGRTTQNGIQYVYGVPIHESSFFLDPREPAVDSYIPRILSQQTAAKVISLRNVSEWSHRVRGNDKKIIVFDATSIEDMRQIGSFLKEKNKLQCLAGCAGFAELLPEMLSLRTDRRTDRRNEWSVHFRSPLLIVCGSLQESSLKQARYVEDHGLVGFFPDIKLLLMDPGDWPHVSDELKTRALSQLKNGKDIILRSAIGRDDEHRFLERGSRMGLNKAEIYARVSVNIAKLTRFLVDESYVKTIVLVGGDTSARFIEELGMPSLQLGSELFPGIPVVQLTYQARLITLITKAGGFGNADILLRIREVLRRSMKNTV